MRSAVRRLPLQGSHVGGHTAPPLYVALSPDPPAREEREERQKDEKQRGERERERESEQRDERERGSESVRVRVMGGGGFDLKNQGLGFAPGRKKPCYRKSNSS